MRKLTFLLACLFLVGVGLVNAQSRSVSGKVVSADDGQPIIGATVMVRGTTNGTITDADGKFSISLQGTAKTLLISYVGMKSLEIEGTNNMIVKLQSDELMIDELVVTAFGLKRSEKSIGFSASTVKGDDINASKGASVMGGLQGKVAGLTITSAGGTGSSQKVVIRGVTSFSGSNQPLYVVNGVPMQNDFQGDNGSNNSVDFGNQASDINPDDVESVTVLKGASATALYGSRAANGVIVITTKRGTNTGKLSVIYNGSVTASNVLRVPQTQQTFGQGWPFWDAAENGSWGPRLDGRENVWGAYSDNGSGGPTTPPALYSDYKIMSKPFSYIKDNMRDFYETGMEYNNTLSIASGGENTSFLLSFGNVTTDGILPTKADMFKRNIVSFRGDTKYKKFSASYDVNYVKKNITAVSSGQGSDGATMFQEIAQMPVDIPVKQLKDYKSIYHNVDNFYTWYAQNPFWVVANNGNEYKDDRVYGKVELNLDLVKGLKWVGRIGGDYTNSRQRSWNAVAKTSIDSWSYGNKNDEVGTYQEKNSYVGQLDATTFLSADYQLNSDFRLTGIAGVNYNERSGYNLKSYLFGLVQPGWYSLLNGGDNPVTSGDDTSIRFGSVYNRRLFGALGQFDLSFRDWAFATVSLRNDWSSTLPTGLNSYFYPGVNATAILTDAIPAMKSDVLNMLKLRAAWGMTGNDANTYLTSSVYLPTQVNLGMGSVYTPIVGVLGLTESNRAANNALRPELTSEIEFGFEAKFLNNRLGIDASYYNKNTKDQIILATVAPETRFTSQARNIGLVNNQGVELRVWGVPVKTKDFNWEIGFTFAKNRSEVKELWEGAKEYIILSAYGVNFKAIKGQPLGVFTVPQAATAGGKTIVANSGRPLIDPVNQKTVGSSAPDFTAGLTNRFTFKGISLGAVLDMRKGGKFWSNTAELMAFDGNSTITTFNNRQPFIVPNSVKNIGTTALPNYVENDIPIGWQAMYSYYNHSTNTVMYEKMVLDKSYIKLREVTLSYTLPKRLFTNSALTSIEVSFIGRNLLMWTPQENNFVDPEATNYGNDLLSDFGEFSAGPTMRNIGGSIKVIF
ncbi:MAG: SusC/RagA family TonB-linked outer membrane protein [Paludibacter sp.]|nr:SusC/RagA family TonB-linked outer membrane protein [Paludibacter sp.]